MLTLIADLMLCHFSNLKLPILLFIYLFIYVLLFVRLGLHLQHVEVPRLGVESEL